MLVPAWYWVRPGDGTERDGGWIVKTVSPWAALLLECSRGGMWGRTLTARYLINASPNHEVLDLDNDLCGLCDEMVGGCLCSEGG